MDELSAADRQRIEDLGVEVQADVGEALQKFAGLPVTVRLQKEIAQTIRSVLARVALRNGAPVIAKLRVAVAGRDGVVRVLLDKDEAYLAALRREGWTVTG